MRRILEKARFRLNGDRLKTVGIKPAVWRELKQLATDQECTLSDAIELLIEKSKKHGNDQPGRSDSKPTSKPD